MGGTASGRADPCRSSDAAAHHESGFEESSGRQCCGFVASHPHRLIAAKPLLNGAPLPAVMRLGGWRKLSTVQRYTYMNDAVAAEVHAKTSPLARA